VSLKARSSKDYKRKDAQYSASVVASILQLIFDKKHVYYRQFEICLAEINTVYSKVKGIKDSQHTIMPHEVDFFQELYSRMKSGKEFSLQD
jgi:hypothetical protein